jgi:hypothetical protein
MDLSILQLDGEILVEIRMPHQLVVKEVLAVVVLEILLPQILQILMEVLAPVVLVVRELL